MSANSPWDYWSFQGSRVGLVLTLRDFLSAEDLGNLLLKQLVTLLTNGDNLLASNTELGNLGKDLLRDLGGSLVLGESVGVVEGVVCNLHQ